MTLRISLLPLCLVIFFLTAVGAHAQHRLIGHVLDEMGRPLPGASVVVSTVPSDGSSQRVAGSASDRQGRFDFELPQGTYIVTASFVGYRSASVSVEVPREDPRRLELRLEADILREAGVIVESRRVTPLVSPVTYSNLTARELEALPAMKDLPVHLSTLPSITFHSENGNGIGYSTLRMRGFDQRRIAVSINGIPQNDPEDFNVFWINFFDIQGAVQDIQVQRGANAAFYGPEGIGGAINIVARPYTEEPFARIEGGLGSFATRRLTAEASSGRVGAYSAFVRVSRLSTDGYRDNSWSEFVRFFAGVDRTTPRGSLVLQAYGGPQRDGLAFSGVPADANHVRGGDGTLALDRRFNASGFTGDTESFHQPHVELLHEWRPRPGLTVNQALFGVMGVGYFDFGATFRSADYLRLPADFGRLSDAERGLPLFVTAPDATVLQRAYLDQWQVGWLPRLSLDHAWGTTSLGLEGRLHRSLRWGRIEEATGLPAEVVGSDNDVRIYAFRGEKTIASVFGTHLYRPHARLAVQADLHLTHRQYRVYDESYFGNAFSTSFAFLNPRVGATFNPGRPTSAYLSAAIAHREPRMKDIYDGEEAGAGFVPRFEEEAGGGYDFDRTLVRPERLWNLEGGARHVSRTLRVSANVFLMLFDDEIVPSGGLDQFGVPRSGNAERTRHVGIELDAEASVTDGVSVIANATISRNRFMRFTEYDAFQGPARRDGNPIAGFPERTAYAGLRLDRGFAALQLGSRYAGRQFVDNSANRDISVPPYALVDASLMLKPGDRLGDLSLRIDINNVFDSLVLMYGNVGPLGPQYFPAATRHVYAGLTYTLR
jgi:iron complex outermembrane recepter protein